MAEIIFEGSDSVSDAIRLAAGFAARQLLNNDVPVEAAVTSTGSGNVVRGRLTDQIDTTISIDGREIELADVVSLTIVLKEEP